MPEMDSAGKIGLRRAFLAISAMQSRSRGITSNTRTDLRTLPTRTRSRAKTYISNTSKRDCGGPTAQVSASTARVLHASVTQVPKYPLSVVTVALLALFQKNNCHLKKKDRIWASQG